METNFTPKKENFYYCEKCNFKCSKKSDFERHLITLKHKNKELETKKTPELICCYCNKKYKSKSGLWKHEQKCYEEMSKKFPEKMKLKEESSNTLEMFHEIMNENKELRKTIQEMIPKIGNNTINQKFNLNVFLNEDCKDAINLTDFIESLQIQLKDLENTKSNGLVESIASILIDNLNEMDLNKRPIHCTDPKRDILYIKDSKSWAKDDEKAILRQSINELANKQRKAMKEWTDANPDWKTDEKLKDEYVKLLHELMEPLEQTEKDQNKIIKKICNATIIEKEGENED
jgi:hypothetical protein